MKQLAFARNVLVPFALAALAGTAAAQSTVTIYGIIDLGVTKQNGGTTTLAAGVVGGGPASSAGRASAAANRWDVRQGWASRLGFRGNEDLGGGYSAGFVLEHRWAPDTGAIGAGDPFWSGNSTVKLGSPYGEVYMGRDNMPAFWVGMAGDPFDYGYVGTLGRFHVFANYASGDFASTGSGAQTALRTNNTLGYKSPNYSGLTGQASVSAGEASRGTLGREFGMNLQYKAGPIYAGFGYDQIANNGVGNDPKLIVVAATYDFGFIRPMATYTRVTPTIGGNTKDFSIGAKVPVGTGVIKAVVALLDPAGDNNDTTKVGLGYEYPLSKRTFLYTNIGSAKNEAFTRTTAVDAGIRHHF